MEYSSNVLNYDNVSFQPHFSYQDQQQNVNPDFGGTAHNYAQHMSMKVASQRPSFKGSLEDLVMITNFKRFKRKGSTSRYKGVFFVKKEKKYRAQICLKGKKKYVGTFKNDRDAAVARDKKIREMFGEVEELLNFPLSKANEQTNDFAEDEEKFDEASFDQPLKPSIYQNDASNASNLLSTLTNGEDESKLISMRNRFPSLNRYGSSQSSWMGMAANFAAGTENGVNPNNEVAQPFQYNQLLNNFHEMLPKTRTMLPKRFSSNDSCATGFSLNLGNEMYTPSTFNPAYTYNNYVNTNTISNHNSFGDEFQQPIPPTKRIKTDHELGQVDQ